MRRFAIIISGQARILNRSFLDYLDKEGVQYDVYVHYWKPVNNSYENCGNVPNSHNVRNIPDNLHENIINTYHPKRIECDVQILFPFDKEYINYPTNIMQNTISQFYGIYKAFNLIDNLDDYTHFIRIRFDLEYISSLDKSITNTINIKSIDNKSLYFIFNNNYLIDILWIVPRIQVNIFNLYNYIYQTNNYLTNMPEMIIHKFLNENYIIPKDIDINCIIDRSYRDK